MTALLLSALLGSLLAATAQPESISAASLCEQALLGFRAGPVNFEESGTAIRRSGEPVLDQVIDLASTCRQSVVEITGHTDSSGDETWNRILSLKRAQAVADYLTARGVARERLVVNGAGSSKPIADNALRYGRHLNRRIEILMRPQSAADISQ